MEQQRIERPFGTEGCVVRVAFTGYDWTVSLTEKVGRDWPVLDRRMASSSDGAIALAMEMLATYRDVLNEGMF